VPPLNSIVRRQVKQVLFVCHGNTCRSVMAAYIVSSRFPQNIKAQSAGLCPGAPSDALNAIDTLRAHRIDASGHVPRDVRDVDISTFDVVVAMDSAVARQFKKLFPNFDTARLATWRIQDPYGDDLSEYEICANRIHREVDRLRQNL